MASSVNFDEEGCYLSIIESYQNPRREDDGLWFAKTVIKIQKAYETHLNPKIVVSALVLSLSLMHESFCDPLATDAIPLSKLHSQQKNSLKELLKDELFE